MHSLELYLTFEFVSAPAAHCATNNGQVVLGLISMMIEHVHTLALSLCGSHLLHLGMGRSDLRVCRADLSNPKAVNTTAYVLLPRLAELSDPLFALVQFYHEVLSNICQRDCGFMLMPPGENRRAYDLMESNRECLAAVLASAVMTVG